MKKLFSLILVFAVILCGCTVGPEENPREPLVTPDVTASPEVVEPEYLEMDEEYTPPDPGIFDDVEEPEPEPDETEPAVTEPEPESEPEPVTAPDLEYDVEFYEPSETMYSTISLNVRSGPSVDFESIGSLREGQAATVVGRASTGWYLIEYNEDYGYVSGSYMTYDDPNPEPESNEVQEVNYPAINISADTMAQIRFDYAILNTVIGDDTWLRYYYGTYSGGEAVVMSLRDGVETDDINEFKVGGYDFWLPSGSLQILIHTKDGKFIELSKAYADKLVSDEDLAAISYYNKNTKGLPMPEVWSMVNEYLPRGSYPELDVLDSVAEDKLKKDYEKANSLASGVAYVSSYFGTYSGGEAVVMWEYDPSFLPDEKIGRPVTGDINEFVVGGHQFYLGSGSLDITIHTKDGKFVPLADAYAQGLVTEGELDMISYYNLPSWYY